VSVSGVQLDDLDLRETIAILKAALARRVRGYVVTPNIDHIVRYQKHPAFRASYDAAALRLADGVPVVWASRLLGQPLKARVAGADLLPALCEMAAGEGYSIFLCGGESGVAERAAAALARRFPGVRIAGMYTPPQKFQYEGLQAEAAVRAVNETKPDILCVALGSPTQELWTHRYWDQLQVTVAVCCGAALDYAAGVKVRAPLWMQRAGLEWLWRLAHEPGRLWKRYLVQDAAFLGIFMKEWWERHTRTWGR